MKSDRVRGGESIAGLDRQHAGDHASGAGLSGMSVMSVMSVMIAEVCGWLVVIPSAEVQTIATAAEARDEVLSGRVALLDLALDLADGLSAQAPQGGLGERRAVRWRRAERCAWLLLEQSLWFEEVEAETVQKVPLFIDGLRALIGLDRVWIGPQRLGFVLDVALLLDRQVSEKARSWG